MTRLIKIEGILFLSGVNEKNGFTVLATNQVSELKKNKDLFKKLKEISQKNDASKKLSFVDFYFETPFHELPDLLKKNGIKYHLNRNRRKTGMRTVFKDPKDQEWRKNYPELSVAEILGYTPDR